MKPYLRVAAVTAALQEALLPAVHAVIADGQVKSGPPFDGTRQRQTQGLNLFLFQVQRNEALAPQDLPSRAADGSLLQAPVAALDLHYLFTFYGEPAQQVPEQLLGSVMSWIHTWPVFTQRDLQKMAEASPGGLIDASGIAQQFETVKLSFLPLGIEEITRLWTVFQVPYALTVAVRASVVLLETLDPPPEPKRVKTLQLVTRPLPMPEVAVVVEPPATAAELEAGDTLDLALTGAPADTLKVTLNGVVIETGTVRGDTARVALTPELLARASVRAGKVHVVLVSDEGPRLAETAFTLRPAVQRVGKRSDQNGLGSSKARSVTLTAQVIPAVAPGQAIAMTLTRTDRSGSVPLLVPATRTDTGGLAATVTDVEVGTYRVGVVVDETASKPLPAPRNGLAADTVRLP